MNQMVSKEMRNYWYCYVGK